MSEFLHINDINIPVRYRIDYGDIESLAKSISLTTLFNPVIVTQNHDLNQGGRRLSALRLIYAINHPEESNIELERYDDVSIHIIQNCQDANLKEGLLRIGFHVKIHNFEDRYDELVMELEENIRRKDLDWKERAMLIKAIDEEKRKLSKEGKEKDNWGIRDTAAHLQLSTATISHDLRIAEALEAGDTNIVNAKDRKTALNTILFNTEQALYCELQRRKAERLKNTKASGNLYNLDALELAKQLKIGDFNHVITDPPYAIEFDELTEEKHESENYIEMSREEYYPYMTALAEEIYSKIQWAGYFVCFCAHEHWHNLASIFEEVGFSVSSNPLIWYKEGSPGKNNHPDKHLTSVAEFAVVAWKGIPEMNKPGKGNVFPYKNYIDVKERFHITQKPIELLEDVIDTFTKPGETLVDFFMGSGSTIKAAIKRKRHYIGNDKSKYFAQARMEIIECEINESMPKFVDEEDDE